MPTTSTAWFRRTARKLMRSPRPVTQLHLLHLEDRAVPAVTGTVFLDYNANGTLDTSGAIPTASGIGSVPTAVDVGLSGVTITAFDVNGTVVGTAVSGPTGGYAIPAGSGQYRVEFTNLPAGTKFGPTGGTAGTAVQFVNDATSNNTNLSVVSTADYSSDNPLLITGRSVYGGTTPQTNSGANLATPGIVGFPSNAGAPEPDQGYPAHSQPVQNSVAIPFSQVGSTWGLGYSKQTATAYAAAYTKRHSGWGPAGPGAIYSFDVPDVSTPNKLTTNASSWYTFPTAAVADTGAGSLVARRAGYTSIEDYNRDADNTGWDAVGKSGLGGLDVNDLGNQLYVANLYDRKLYVIGINPNGSAGAATSFTVPRPSNATGEGLGDVRPFAVEFHKGLVYVGLVNSAESSRDSKDLRAYVYTFNPATGQWSTRSVVNDGTGAEGVALNYNRGDSFAGVDQFLPWSSTFQNVNPLYVAGNPAGNDGVKYPQPMLTGLTFDGAGNLVLGFRDRTGDQTGKLSFSDPSNPTLPVQGVGAGDILRAFIQTPGDLSSGWRIEANATSPVAGNAATGTGANNFQGPGGGEFFGQDGYGGTSANGTDDTGHRDVGVGGVLQLPGRTSVAMTAFDPVRTGVLRSAGVRWFDTNGGEIQRSYYLYIDDNTNSFGKASGLTDLIAITELPPVEIGNFVWNDTNENGVQDAGEAPAAGVQLQLLGAGTDGTFGTADDVALGTATTDANGNYGFSNGPGTSTTSKIYGLAGLVPGQQYQVRAALNQPALANKTLTAAFRDASANGTGRDSNATIEAGFAVVNVTVGTDAGSDHTFDLGVFNTPLVSIGDFVFEDTNNDGVKNNGEQGLDGITVNLFRADGTTFVGTLTTQNGGFYRFTGLTPGGYVVEIVPPEGYGSSTGANGQNTGPYEPGITENTDDADHGTTTATNTVRTAVVTLAAPGTTANPDTDGTKAGNANYRQDFGLIREFAVGNVVWYDRNNNGARDASEPGLAGIEVRLLDAGGRTVTAATTNALGGYLFKNLQPGAYRVFIPAQAGLAGLASSSGRNGSAAGPFEPTAGGPNDNVDHGSVAPGGYNGPLITLASNNQPRGEEATLGGITNPARDGDSDLTQDFGFFRPQAVGNLVWNDVNNNGLRDAGEPGIDGVLVELLDGSGTVVASKSTAGGGEYRFDGLTPGTYSVRITPPAGYLSSNGGVGSPFEPGKTGTEDNQDHGTKTGGYFAAAAFTLGDNTNPDEAGAANLRQDFGLYQTLTLGDLVWYDANNNGSVDAGEPGIAGATVTLVDAAGQTVGTKVTDAAGNYLFTDLLPGKYTVRVVPGGSLPYRSSTGGTGSPFEPGVAGDQNNQDHGTTAGAGAVASVQLGTVGDAGNPDGNGSANLRQDFGFYLPLSVGNQVWYDKNNNGVRETDEAGLAGIAVTLLDTAGKTVATTTTAADGTYLFVDLLPGTYAVRITGFKDLVSSNGNGPNFKDANGPFEPAKGNTDDNDQDKGTQTGGTITTNLFVLGTATQNLNPDLGGLANFRQDFGLTDPPEVPVVPPPPVVVVAQVSGYVFRDYKDINGDRQPDKGETGIGGTKITLTGNGITRTTTTDRNGFYSFTGLPVGTYTITETQPAGFQDGIDKLGSLGGTTPGNDVHTVTLKGGDAGTDYNFGELIPSSLFGFVYEDRNRSKLFDAGDAPISGVTLTITGTAFAGTILARPLTAADTLAGLTVRTDASGRWEFPLLPPGTYTVTEAQPTNYLDYFESNQEPKAGPADVGNDVFGNVVIPAGDNRGPLNYGEIRQARASDPTKQDFLGSTDGSSGGISSEPGQTPGLSVDSQLVALDPTYAASSNDPSKPAFLVTAGGAGRAPLVRVFDFATKAEKFRFYAYESGFTGGVRVAVADVNGDGTPDIVTATGVGGGPRIRVFSGVDGGVISEYFAYEPGFRGGVFVAAADVNGDGKADIITGTEVGGGPRVTLFSGADGGILGNYFAFDKDQRGGVRVAAADFNGDGRAEVVAATGNGVPTRVRVLNAADGGVLSEFAPYDTRFTGGVFVAAGDVDGDGTADIVTSADVGGGPHVQVFSGLSGTATASYFAYEAGFTGGVRVALTDVDGDGKEDIVTAPGGTGAARVRVWQGGSLKELDSFYAFDTTFTGGVFVG